MATFNFETISATDALAYNSASDALIFSNPASKAARYILAIGDAPAT